ncbi:MAG TPA: site-specific DNA-methyltransferase [Alphaproteobacteria bacterium]|nr:site-specific DNA-methyltransferase [Alphaproteobacteria bacterium]HIK86998.1 site-specific DNA-methyltransferase [Alphaproteobacteria bacterium]
MKVIRQVHEENYSIYNGDCMEVLPTLDDNSIDLIVNSPPFAGLYNYSSSNKDFSNCDSKEQFLEQYEYLVKECARVTKPGRINAIHVMEIINQKGSNWDFPHEVVKIHEKYGFEYKNRITIWKEPLKVRMRTMVMSLMHKFIVEDSTNCFTASPDYVLIFKKKGDNQVPVIHPFGLKNYAGAVPILPNILTAFNNANNTTFNEAQLWQHLNNEYYDSKEPNNKLSHYIWQRYASSTWDDIRIDEVLKYKNTKDEDDEKHVHPLQLDVIDRIVELYSNPNEVVLTPFMGVGSEVFSPVSNGRKAIGIELKESYFKQSILNIKGAANRFKKEEQNKLF